MGAANGCASSCAGGGSPLARWDARLRLPALVLLAFAFSSVKDVRAIAPMLLVAGAFWALSGLPVRYLLHRLRYPSMLVLFFAAALAFGSGKTVLYKLGFVSVTREGLDAAMLVAGRFYAILTLAIAFLSVAPLLANIAAMQALGLPFIMVDMALLMVRYLEVLKQDLHNMHISMRLRGFQNKGWSLKTVKTSAWLAASLLLRSYERADGGYKAMRLRGYGQEAATRHYPPIAANQWLCFALVAGLSGLVFWLG